MWFRKKGLGKAETTASYFMSECENIQSITMANIHQLVFLTELLIQTKKGQHFIELDFHFSEKHGYYSIELAKQLSNTTLFETVSQIDGFGIEVNYLRLIDDEIMEENYKKIHKHIGIIDEVLEIANNNDREEITEYIKGLLEGEQ